MVVEDTQIQVQGRGFYEVDKLGGLWMTWSSNGLVSISWTESGSEQSAFNTLPEPSEVPERYASFLTRYFRGEEVDPAELPVVLIGTPFQKRVWSALRKIPRGSVRSYGGIASDVDSPRAARAVGNVSRINPLPIVVPCHRVVETGMGLGGYSGGLDRKRFLLSLEGVRIVGNKVQPGQLELLKSL